MFDLAGKTALVTGATGGIGGAIAKRCTRRARPSPSPAGRRTSSRRWPPSSASAATSLPCDLADRAASPSSSTRPSASSGALDILVNNAGLTRDNLFMVMKDEQWDEVIAVNLTSTFMLCRAAARAHDARQAGFGRIINIASVSGVFGNPGQGNYCRRPRPA